VISTPVTIVSGLTAAARKGILIKGGSYLERGRKLTWLALDKTGTITHGTPSQTYFEALADTNADRCRQLAASLAGRSDHPVSRALARAADIDNIGRLSVDDFEALPGRGMQEQSTANLTRSAITAWLKSSGVVPPAWKRGSTRWNAMEKPSSCSSAKKACSRCSPSRTR